MLERYVKLPVSKLVKANWNYKGQDDAKTAALTANMVRNGQVENLIVRRLETGFYEVVNGNHRYDVLVALGAQTALCYDLGEVSLAFAQRLAIETNETHFAADDFRLAEVLRAVAAEFSDEDFKATLPFSDEELNAFMALEPVEAGEYDAPSGVDDDAQDEEYTTIKCPKCGKPIRYNKKFEVVHG